MLSLDQAGAGLPLSRRVSVPGALDPWVEGAWIQAGRDAGDSGGWRIVPDASPHLIVSVSDGPVGRSVRASVVGPRSRAVDARGRRRMTVAVRLRPGALPRLTGEDAGAFTDRSVTLDDALGGAGSARVFDAAAEEDGPGAMEALVRLLLRRLPGAGPVDWRVRALEADPRAGPADVARRAGVSPRGLRAAAAREVGLSPGLVLRIRRLQRALALRLDGREASWSSAALAAGFHDPAHLVRTARALLGETPEAFRRRAPDARAGSYNAREGEGR